MSTSLPTGYTLDKPSTTLPLGYSVDSAPSTPAQKPLNVLDSGDPRSTPDSGIRGQIERFGQGAAQNITQTVMHPLKAIGSMAEATPAGSLFDLATGRPDAMQQMGKSIGTGLVKQPANTLGQMAGGFAAAHVVPAIGGSLGSASEAIHPTPSSSIVPPEEMAARKLTAAVSPDASKASNYIQAAQKEVPNVLDYARRQNNPLKTQIEFNKAAEGSAQEARNHYEQNILGPNASKHVDVPENYGGNSYTAGGENPKTTASLGDIDKRVIQINKELSGPSSKLNEGDQRAALASKASLQQEHGHLTDLLHKSLSDLTGVAPEDIANLRQRVGRSYELANDTNAAVTKRGLQEGKSIGSIPHPSLGNLAVTALEKLRGGPTAIADRSFQRSIRDFPGQAEPLPQITGPKPRPQVAARTRPIMPPGQPQEVPVINTGDVEAQAANRARNQSLFKDNQESSAAEEQRRAANRSTAGKRLDLLAKKKGLVQ